jgi:hypothetical protein
VDILQFAKTIRTLFFIWVIAIPATLSAQFYQSGIDPASIHWKQIKTENFQVIFPPEFQNQANRLANTLEYLYNYEGKSLNHKPRKISVILHSQSSFSNGFVSWAPKRMELYTTPTQDNYAQDWLDQLAVHELRHVVQIDKLNQGLTKIISLVLGQQAVGAVTGLIPRWFLEGDAVYAETSLTSSGRGRQASFEMPMKTLVTTNDKLFSYEKALLGSYKDYIPDYYTLGYPMVAWSRMKFGTSMYNQELNFVARNPYVLFPFPLGLKRQIGLPSRKLYRAAYGDLKQKWNNQTRQTKENVINQWNTKTNKDYTSYRFPEFVNDTTLLVVKSGMDQLTQFVTISKNGDEKLIHTPGSFYRDKFSYAAGKFVWAEEIPDIRWSNRSYFCIKIGDLKSGKIKMLTRRTRYFAPALSPDGSKIVASEVTQRNENFLVILNSKTGEIVDRIQSPENRFIQMPDWLNNNEIVVITTGSKGKSMEQFHLTSANWQTLIPPKFQDISLPSDAGEYIVFVSDFNGTNNIYALKKSDLTIWQVTDSKFGAFDPKFSTNNNTLFFAQYTSQGYRIASTSFDPNTWTNINKVTNTSVKLYETSAKQEHFNFQDSIISLNNYPVSNYNKISHMFNLHSWAPFYYNYSNPSISNAPSPGITLLSQDKLGTCLASLGYSFNKDQSFAEAGVTYNRFFPEISFTLDYGGSIPIAKTSETTKLPPTSNNDLSAVTNIFVPLNLTRGRFLTGITPGIGISYEDKWFYNPSIKDYQNGMTMVSYVLSAYRYSKESLRDLAPRWGITADGRYTYTPFENIQLGDIWYVQSSVYLPGILYHHSLRFSLAYQEQQPLRYLYASLVAFPRGIISHTTYKLTSFTADYAFPICYPDFHLGPLLYIKRLRSDLFFDYANNWYKYYNKTLNKTFWQTENLNSTGIDITADFHLLRIIFPFNSGIRIIYLPQSQIFVSSFLFRIDLSNY